ncbi:MAG TPA: diphosphate--fructose-6-phosphate 1-phosphotransferase, partial [Chloroflexota bacterium]
IADSEADDLLETFRANDIRYLTYIGGNDSADTLLQMGRRAAERGYELRTIAVPKTIDNDLPVTDHSPGYGSIARYVAMATMDSAQDTESMPTMYPVKIIEVMGRNAGWVAAAAALGKRCPVDAPHLVYVPERPLSPERLLRDVERVYRTVGHVVAVVAETVRDESGHPFADPALSGETDAFGHPLLRGTAGAMCRIIQAELGLRARYDKPGSLQRMSSLCISPVDLDEANQVGRAAVRIALADESNRMVTLIRDGNEPYRSHTESAPLEEIANRQRLLPDAFLNDDGTDVTDAFREYALPLLGPSPLPAYTRLSASRAPVRSPV